MSDEIDMAQDAEELFRQNAIENARKVQPAKVCPCCQGRLRHEDGWLVCDSCGYEKDTRF